MPEDFARLAYEVSLRRLDKQQEWLIEIRSRTGLLLAASSLAASFLGRPALEADSVGLALAALAAFVITIGASLYVLLPTRKLVFALVGSRLYESLYDFRDDLAEVHKALAYVLDRFWEANDRTLERVLWRFRVAAFALGVEVVLLLAGVGGNLG
jgi:hypothetical protein